MKTLVKSMVSIIIPVYNTNPEFLKECFLSVLNQDYELFEAVVVNDGSINEDTNSFLSAFCEEHRDCFRLINKTNEGVCVARKAGLFEACGEYVMFVDSDDSLHSHALWTLTDKIEKTMADAVISEDYVRSNIPAEQLIEGSANILSALLENRESSFGWALWAKLFRTELMRKCYVEYPNIFYGEDLLENALYFEKAEKVVIINEALYSYRNDNADSAMHQAVTKKKLSLADMWHEMENVYTRNGLAEASTRIRANYYDSILGGYLQCAYYKFDDYKNIMKRYRAVLCSNMRDIQSNPYVNGKYKYYVAVYFLWLFKLKHFLERKK